MAFDQRIKGYPGEKDKHGKVKLFKEIGLVKLFFNG
jgi:hypothetical protein